MNLILATKNPGKIAEITEILHDMSSAGGLKILTLADYPGFPDVEEKGTSYRENAVTKAVAVTQQTGMMALADDTGLEVTALGGVPGVHSARFAGPGASDADNRKKLLSQLAGVPKEQRTARFVCTMALSSPPTGLEGWLDVEVAEGTCEGVIAEKERGDGGFGYDSLFFVLEEAKTFAELDPSVKNRISHRARALSKIKGLLLEKIGQRQKT